jgi:hypothetical protein
MAIILLSYCFFIPSFYYSAISKGSNRDAIAPSSFNLTVPLDYKPVIVQVACIKIFELKYMGALLSNKVKNPYVKLSLGSLKQETKPIGNLILEN